MDQEIKQKWVEALRSGKYKQGEGALKNGDKYCCLGVLCSVIKARNWVGHGVLPGHIQNKVGLLSIGAKIRMQNGSRTSLVRLNDTGMPFSEIADLIEAQL